MEHGSRPVAAFAHDDQSALIKAKSQSGLSGADHALRYAARGWAVFPLHGVNRVGECTCRRGPKCSSPGKHPRTRNGHRDATTDGSTIRQWWSKCPNANIGIATGADSGLVVVDIDPRNGGDATLAGLIQEHRELPETPSVSTGGGGYHLYFAYPGTGQPIKGKGHALGPGIDVKANSGYVVAPPSAHASGHAYEWSALESQQPAALPDWILGLLTREKVPKPTLDGATSKISVGNRNNYLTSVGGRLRGEGKSNWEIEIYLLEENQLKFDNPLEDAEVRKIARSVSKYPPNKPKRFLFIWRDLIMSVKGPDDSTMRFVLLALSLRMDMNGRSCYPTIEQLATATGLSERCVKEKLTIAAKLGYIRRYKHRDHGQQWWNYGYIATKPGESDDGSGARGSH